MIPSQRVMGPRAAARSSAEGDPAVPILIVDDNPAKRLALKAVLSPLGHSIVEADSALGALRCVMAQNFAVILLDVCMPITDGFETAALIRQRRQSEMTPIIFITAFGSDEIMKADLYAEGAVDFIFAPVPPDELRAKVSVFARLHSNAEELADRAREVQASADQLRLLTDAAPIGIFQTDGDNRYIYTNPRWSEITGVTAEEALGENWGSILNEQTRAGLASDLANPDTYRGELCHRIEITADDAPSRFLLVTSTAIPYRTGGTAGWVGTMADVTAEVDAEAAMTAARDAAIAATAMQKTFAASASHELRTPTTSILGYAEELLDSEHLSAEDRGFVEIVYRNGHRLSQLIDDLLIVGEAEIGAAMMHFEPTQMAPLVDGVLSNFTAAAQHAGLRLIAGYTADAPTALVDPHRFEQALTNVIGNAIKFTPDGGEVRIKIRESADMVDVTVTDTGAGIDPADIDNIFGRFYRTKSATDSTIKGSGLGLSIARRMIEAQAGELRATSELGRGSTFTISVPVATRELQRA